MYLSIYMYRFRKLPLLALLFLFSACEINQGRKSELKSDDSIILSIFFADQYATTSPSLRDFFSTFHGTIAAAENFGNLRLLKSPPTLCDYSVNYRNDYTGEMGLKRLLDVGELKVKTGDNPLPLRKIDNYYDLDVDLERGANSLQSPGVKNGVLNFEQSFQVLESGGNIRIFEKDDANAPVQNLVSPEIPEETDRILFDRNKAYIVQYDAPTGTQYVRVRLRDGTSRAEGDISCFAKLGENLEIVEGALYGFTSGNLGHMEVDFITVSTRTDIPRLQESSIISTMRHFQGTFTYQNGNKKETLPVGVVEFN